MNREEALRAVVDYLHEKGHDGLPMGVVRAMAGLVWASRRAGAEEMRERAASFVANWRWGNHDNGCTISAPEPLADGIRALPLDQDPEQAVTSRPAEVER